MAAKKVVKKDFETDLWKVDKWVEYLVVKSD